MALRLSFRRTQESPIKLSFSQGHIVRMPKKKQVFRKRFGLATTSKIYRIFTFFYSTITWENVRIKSVETDTSVLPTPVG